MSKKESCFSETDELSIQEIQDLDDNVTPSIKRRRSESPIELNINKTPSNNNKKRKSNKNCQLVNTVPNKTETPSTIVSKIEVNMESPNLFEESALPSPISINSSAEDVEIPDNKPIDTETINTNNKNINLINTQFEEELKCSICSELFMNAVTLNCTHSFCEYCINKWKTRHSTCPICRQKISCQVSTLVLNKCVEKMLEHGNKEEALKRRKEIMDSRKLDEERNVRSPTNSLLSVDFGVDDDFGNNNDINDDLNDEYNYPEYADDIEQDSDFEMDHFDSDLDQSEIELNVHQYCNYDDADEDNYEDPYEDDEDNDEDEEDDDDDDGDDDDEGSSDDNYCFNCFQRGHHANSCVTSVPFTGVPGSYYGGYGTCFRCHEEGHWANGCPN